MARARNIKPSIMDNEQLAALSALERLLFIYLWMLADRDGRLEDRPKRIEKQALPYEEDIDIEAMLSSLHKEGFIKRYRVDGKAYIQIVNFLKHQRPHSTEKDGQYPDENGFLIVQERSDKGYATGRTRLVNCAETVQQQLDNTSLTVKEHRANALIPDTGFTDSKNTPQPPKGGGQGSRKKASADLPDGFAEFWAEYPRKDSKVDAVKAWQQGGLHEDLAKREKAMAGLARWKRHEQWTKDNGQFIPMPGPFLRKERWNDGTVSTARPGPTGPVLAPDDPLRAKAAALPADWWRIAGFDSKYDAEASRCNWMNYTEFHNRERVAPVEGAPA